MQPISQLEPIFFAALGERDPVARAALLDQACGGDAAMRQRIERMLAIQEDSFLGGPTGPYAGQSPSPPEGIGSRIGPYLLQELIGEGGMGLVFVAAQERPVRRQVALKVIKPGLDTRQVIARFEAERQALALMDHSHIAKVLDAGATESGRPYFVMELVPGVAITEYCDQCELPTRERLELFVLVCKAVQHAHQKGVIHRDIKPSNVLVTIQDGQAAPKIIDFGVAKAIGQKLTDDSLATGFTQMIGTPLYMSPEQAELSQLGVDTRSDIYSLGVLLYELLTGATPFDKERLRAASYDELRRIIREEEPPCPSARLSTFAADLASTVAARRHSDFRRLSQSVRGELDWIVMKCLEKDRNRRYETVNGLLKDVQRYLRDEPVEARPASAGYRFRKFCRRHRLGVAAAGLCLASLVIGMSGTTWGLIRATRAEASAEERLNEAENARRVAVGEKKKAQEAAAAEKQARLDEERQRKNAEAITSFVFDDILALTSIEGQERFGGTGKAELGRGASLKELLDRAAARLEERSDLDAWTKCRLCWIIGVNYRGIGEFDRSVHFLEQSVELCSQELGDEHPETLNVKNSLAMSYKAASNLPRALALEEKVVVTTKAIYGDDDPEIASVISNLAAMYHDAGRMTQAVAHYEQARDIQLAHLGREDDSTLNTVHNLAVAYSEVGKTTEAFELLQENYDVRVKKYGPSDASAIGDLAALAGCYKDAGQLAKAIELYEQVKDAKVRIFGADHPETLATMDNLARTYRDAGDVKLAIPLFKLTLELKTKRLGAAHRDTLVTLNNLALVHWDKGELDEAKKLLEQARATVRVNFAAADPITLDTLDNLAGVYRASGNLKDAIPQYEYVLSHRVVLLGADNPSTLVTMNNLAVAYSAAQRHDDAIALYLKALDGKSRLFGPDHIETAGAKANLGAEYWQVKQFDKSVPLLEESLRILQSKMSPDHPDVVLTKANLGVNYKDSGQWEAAVTVLSEAYEASKKLPNLDWIGTQLVDLYVRAGRKQELQRLVAELLEEARRRHPEESPTLTTELATLGYQLLLLGACEEAVPILRESLQLREKLVLVTPSDPAMAILPWHVASVQSLLGGALVGSGVSIHDPVARAKVLAEAEPLLVAGWEGLKLAVEDKSLPTESRVLADDTLDRLIALYEAQDRQEEVAKWKAEKAAWTAAATPASSQEPTSE